MRRLLVKHYPYSERDYTFGQLMLTLRTTTGLTQAGLAERLGVSRRAVAEWEAGSSYPKAERLKQLITLGVQQQAFAAGREAEEIRALWKTAQQAPSLVDVADEQTWGADRVNVPLLDGESRVDWGEEYVWSMPATGIARNSPLRSGLRRRRARTEPQWDELQLLY